MDFNFYEQYKSYTNFELLKILKQPGHYQPAAVEAATLILQEREISEQDAVAINDHLAHVAQQEQYNTEKAQLLENKLRGFHQAYMIPLQQNLVKFVQPYVKPDAQVRPAKWLDILLILAAIQYASSLLGILPRLTAQYVPGFDVLHYGFSISTVFDFLYLLVMPVVFFLLLERKPGGWIILFAIYLLLVLIQLPRILTIFNDIHLFDSVLAYCLLRVPYFISLTFKCLLLYLLWRKEVADLLNVSGKAKQYTAVLTIVGGPILIAIIYVLADL